MLGGDQGQVDAYGILPPVVISQVHIEEGHAAQEEVDKRFPTLVDPEGECFLGGARFGLHEEHREPKEDEVEREETVDVVRNLS